MPEQTYVVEMAERLDTMSSVNLVGFRSQINASCVSSHTEKLWYNETVCLWMTIYTLPTLGLDTLVKELTTSTCVMQSFSNELRTLIAQM